jgi:hypothetical protein
MPHGPKKPLFLDGNHWQKGGRSLLPMGEKRQKATMVSSNIVKVFRLNACIVQAYSPTCANAHVWHICAHGGGKGFVNIFENLHETIAKALIMCSYCEMPQLLAMYWWS